MGTKSRGCSIVTMTSKILQFIPVDSHNRRPTNPRSRTLGNSKMTMNQYSKCVGISRSTLIHEVNASELVNHTHGRPHSILTKWQQDFLIDTVI